MIDDSLHLTSIPCPHFKYIIFLNHTVASVVCARTENILCSLGMIFFLKINKSFNIYRCSDSIRIFVAMRYDPQHFLSAQEMEGLPPVDPHS